MSGWLYIMTNRRDGTLYIGVTPDIAARAWQHRTGAVPGFTRKYGLEMLVYVEQHDSIEGAIRRERTLKTWRRAWKVRLITEANPNWDDLYDRLVQQLVDLACPCVMVVLGATIHEYVCSIPILPMKTRGWSDQVRP